MPKRTRAEAEETRAAILAAAEQEFLERGVSRTTLDHIACRAGVTRGAIYWHFRDKLDLLSTMLDSVQLPLNELRQRYRDEMDSDPLGTQLMLCKLGLSRLGENATYRNVCAILFTRCEFVAESNPTFDRQRVLEEEVLERITEVFRRARALGQLKPGSDPRLAALSLYTLLHGIYFCWLRRPECFDVRDDGTVMLEQFFIGLRA